MRGRWGSYAHPAHGQWIHLRKATTEKSAPAASSLGPYKKQASRVHHTRVQLHLAAFTPRRTDVGVSSTKHSVACAAVKGAMMATERQHKALTRAESCARHQHLNVHAPFCVVRARISKRIARRQESTRDGTRTRNLLLRREAPYPLGHTSCCEQ